MDVNSGRDINDYVAACKKVTNLKKYLHEKIFSHLSVTFCETVRICNYAGFEQR